DDIDHPAQRKAGDQAERSLERMQVKVLVVAMLDVHERPHADPPGKDSLRPAKSIRHPSSTTGKRRPPILHARTAEHPNRVQRTQAPEHKALSPLSFRRASA